MKKLLILTAIILLSCKKQDKQTQFKNTVWIKNYPRVNSKIELDFKNENDGKYFYYHNNTTTDYGNFAFDYNSEKNIGKISYDFAPDVNWRVKLLDQNTMETKYQQYTRTYKKQ